MNGQHINALLFYKIIKMDNTRENLKKLHSEIEEQINDLQIMNNDCDEEQDWQLIELYSTQIVVLETIERKISQILSLC